MTRTEALRKVYKKVTNEEAPVTANTITEVLVALADKYSGDEPVTANTITDALVALADNYEGGGGGGSSDFSIAEVTFTSIGGFNDMVFGIPSISDNKLTTLLAVVLDDGESMTVDVPLYKGYCICASPMAAFSNATGSVSIDERGVLTITGDGGVSIELS